MFVLDFAGILRHHPQLNTIHYLPLKDSAETFDILNLGF